MLRRRLVELSLAAALDRGEPLGPALAAVAPVKKEAAANLEAGRLEEGLEAASLDPDLICLAREWPTAVLPAVRGLALVPDRLELLAAPMVTLALLVVPISSFQVVLWLLGVKVWKVHEMMGLRTWSLDVSGLLAALVLMGALGLALVMVVG